MSNGIGGILGLLGIAVLLGGSGSRSGNGDDNGPELSITEFPVFGDQPFEREYPEFHGDEQLFGGGSGAANGKTLGDTGGFDAFTADDSLDPGGGNGGYQAPTIYAVGVDAFSAPIYVAPSVTVTSFQDTIVASTVSSTPSMTFASTPITSSISYAESTDVAEAPATTESAPASYGPFAPGA